MLCDECSSCDECSAVVSAPLIVSAPDWLVVKALAFEAWEDSRKPH